MKISIIVALLVLYNPENKNQTLRVFATPIIKNSPYINYALFYKKQQRKSKNKYVYKSTPFFKVYHGIITKNKKPHKTKKPFLKQLFLFW